VQLLLQVGDFCGSLGALASEALVDGIDGDIDEPKAYDEYHSKEEENSEKKQQDQ
jgi:hypothetical protein